MSDGGANQVAWRGLRVSGGAGGTVAVLEDLERAAAVLRTVALGLLAAAGRVTAAGAAPGWAATAVVSPASFQRAVGALLAAVAGPHGVGPQAVRAELLGDGVAAAAQAYRAAEIGSAAAMDAARVQLGRTLGLPVLAAVALPVVAVAGDRAAHGKGRALYTLMSKGEAVEWVADMLSGAAPGVLAPASGPALGADRSPGSGPTVAGLVVLGAVAVGSRSGGALLQPSGGVRVHVEPAPNPVPARGLAELVRRVPSTAEPVPRVRLERVDAPGGRAWVVGVPGTSTWSPRPGADPFDLTTDVNVMAGRRVEVTDGVLEAMRQAGVRKGEPVLLAGHSLGGLIAASVAADPAARSEFSITHVVTTGSPVASVPLPADVQVLSLEHDEDVVPHLDGDPNPDRPSWVTVQRSVGDADEVVAARDERPAIAHDQRLYIGTAGQVDGSADPSLQNWRAGAEVFLDRPGASVTAFDASIVRTRVR